MSAGAGLPGEVPAAAPAGSARPGRLQRLVRAFAQPGDGTRWLLVAATLLLDALWLPPGVLGVHLPLLVLLGDLPFLLLLWHRGGERWKRWAWLHGTLHFACALHWLAEVGTFQLLGAALVLGPVTVLLGAALRLGARRGVPFVVLVGVAVVLEEMLRTVWFGGMPWPQRALGLVDVAPLRAGSALLGAYGLSCLAGMASAWAAGVLGLVRAPAEAQPAVALRLLGALAAPALLALLLLVHGLGRLGHVEGGRISGEVGVSPPVLLVQGDVPQSLKHSPVPDAANVMFNRHTTLTRVGLERARQRRQQVLAVLWPETMVPWPFLSPALARRFEREWPNQAVIAGRLRATLPDGAGAPHFLVGGIHLFEDEPGVEHAQPDGYGDHDSLFWIDPLGAPRLDEGIPPLPAPDASLLPWERGRHDKVVRVPGGEYTPLEGVLPFLRAWRDDLSQIPEIARGADEQVPFRLWSYARIDAGGKVESRELRAGTVICFEIAFPARCRAWRKAGCQVLLNAANYGWFGQSAFRAQIRAVGALRAAELGVTVAMAGNTGPSLFLDPAGSAYGTLEPVALGPDGLLDEATPPGPQVPAASDAATHQPGVVLDSLYVDDRLTTYARLGDTPWLVLAGLLALLSLRAGRRRAPAGRPEGA